MNKLYSALIFLTKPYYGSNRVSRLLRPYVERISIKKILGAPLAGTAVFAAVILPQADTLISIYKTSQIPNITVIEMVPTESTYSWPLAHFTLTQAYSFAHPGIDMADSAGDPVHPVADGTVAWVNAYPFGYGNHVLINHNDGTKSLYAHLSTVSVEKDEKVTRKQSIGTVGSTGWSTGNHLHLEMYERDAPINPLEVLPDLSLNK